MEEITKIFRALADSTRMRIMLLVLKQELCVCELESVLGMEQSRISHALRILRDAALIEERRDGRWIFYRAARDLPAGLLAYLKEALRKGPEALSDQKMALKLLEGAQPDGKRCPLREKRT